MLQVTEANRFYCLVQQLSGKAQECVQCREPPATPTYHGLKHETACSFHLFQKQSQNYELSITPPFRGGGNQGLKRNDYSYHLNADIPTINAQ
jgi:hypothetical protein